MSTAAVPVAELLRVVHDDVALLVQAPEVALKDSTILYLHLPISPHTLPSL